MSNKNIVEDDEIDLLELARVIWRNILVIALVAAIAGAGMFGYTLFAVEPKYEATASLYVNNSSFSFGATNFSISSGELSAGNGLVPVYIYILKSRTTMEDVITEANLDYTYEQLSKMVSTKAITSTAAFEVTVTSTDPSEAELVANTIAKLLPDRISEIVDGSSVRIVDYAIIPAHRSSPSYTKMTAIGILAGGMVAAAFVILKSLLDDRGNQMIHSSDELRQMYPDLQILAVIPDMRVAGKKGYYYSTYYSTEESGKERKRNGK